MRLEEVKGGFDRDGFVILPGFLTSAELRELRAHAEEAVGRIAGGKQTGTVKNLHQVDAWFEEQLLQGRHVPLIEALLEDELEPATVAWLDRIPSENAVIQPHCDALARRRNGATVWIALDRAEVENGCLHYVKGTHELDLSSEVGSDFGPDSEGAVAVEIDPGDAAIHSFFTVHWSGINLSDRPRRAISYFYWAASC